MKMKCQTRNIVQRKTVVVAINAALVAHGTTDTFATEQIALVETKNAAAWRRRAQ